MPGKLSPKDKTELGLLGIISFAVAWTIAKYIPTEELKVLSTLCLLIAFILGIGLL